jgi:hypothetical protein
MAGTTEVKEKLHRHRMLLMRAHEQLSQMLKDIGIQKDDPDYKNEWKLLRDIEKEFPELKS